jgi:hypothetical protein
MLLPQWLSIDEVPLQLGVFDVQDVAVEQLQISIGHFVHVEFEVVTQYDLQLFGADVRASEEQLTLIGLNLLGFL